MIITDWKIEQKRINDFQNKCSLLYECASLLRSSQEEYNNLIRLSMSDLYNDGSDIGKQLKYSCLQDAYIRRHQSLRLQRIITNVTLELSI